LDTDLFISLLNPAIALVLASAFFVLWFYQRQRPYLVVLALAYAVSAIGFLLQHFTLPVGLPLSRLVSGVSFMIAALCLASAIVARHGRKVPYVALGALSGGGLMAFCWFMFVEPDLTWRIYVMNFAFGGISLVVAAELRPVRNKGPTEGILFVLALLSGLNFFVRTLVAVKVHGPYETYEGFYSSLYWTTALLSHAILSLLIAFSLLAAAALDVLNALRSETQTDPLSGLLNRRGFEAKASALLDLCAPSRLPVALVVADLDRFKALNDRHGHAAGDRVIIEFSAQLRTAAGTRGVAGRLGGEEFTVLLPLTDLASARLLAEALRAVFSAQTIDGLPRDVRVTASFGVAVRDGDESLADLMRRADDALYSAKKGGRDSVRVSYQRPAVSPLPAARLGSA
jgi:diguanylate cyclase (GGDEF)-like protein